MTENPSPPDVQVATSENRWMTTDIFVEWFFRFCSSIAQHPLLLVYDGHSTHINLKVNDKAIEEDITLVNLPPHTTDKLQLPDVCCFKELKINWDKAIAKFTEEHRAWQITKAEFVILTSDVWPMIFTEKNLVNSFSKIGLYTMDQSIYDEDAFNPGLLNIYTKVHSTTQDITHKPQHPQRKLHNHKPSRDKTHQILATYSLLNNTLHLYPPHPQEKS